MVLILKLNIVTRMIMCILTRFFCVYKLGMLPSEVEWQLLPLVSPESVSSSLISLSIVSFMMMLGYLALQGEKNNLGICFIVFCVRVSAEILR